MGLRFRQPSFANSLVLRMGLMIVLTLAVFAAGSYRLIVRPTVTGLAQAQMGIASEQLEARVVRLLQTVEVTLRSSRSWLANGELDHSQLLRYNEFFFPVIAQHGEISSVIFAHESGREILLLLTDDGRWVNRISDPAIWDRQTYWITWTSDRRIDRVEMRLLDYDSRTRPWFKGAMALADDQRIHWTAPYVFYTTRDPGITAAMRWSDSAGARYVIGHDVKLRDLSEFTSALTVGSSGKAALFQQDGRLMTVPRGVPGSDNASRSLSTAEELGMPEIAGGLATWRRNGETERAIQAYSVADVPWLALFRRIRAGEQQFWLGVFAAESDFVPGTATDLALLGEEYRVRVATNGDKALKIVYSDEPPDLILLDIMMPGLSGYDICKRIKANPDRRRIPIVFVTAMSTVEDERLGFDIGAVDYIHKPISPPIVQARVRTHLALYDQTRELERMARQRTQELLKTRQQIIRRLGRAAEYKDNDTGNHVVRMAHYAWLIARASGVGPEAAGVIMQTAPMHDVGKVGIPDAVLLKPGQLDAAEWEVMQTHPVMGAEIIGCHDNKLLDTARTIARTHHERWDGGGYPQRLRGEDILLEGRIVAIADVFDALISVRPYKPAYPVDQSLQIMAEETGHHFDPRLMEAFHAVLPDILDISTIYADERGPLTDLELSPEDS